VRTLVIDTSSARSALALLEEDSVVDESVEPSGRHYDVQAEVHRLCGGRPEVDRVAVALGPGSFTGLRAGISYALGLALGRRLPLLGLETLRVQQARAREPATGVSEAGRGRVYYLTPEGEQGVVEVAALPKRWRCAGWLKTPGVDLLEESELRSFGDAAGALVRTAAPVSYGRVRPQYMTGIGLRR
jgi:tRNA threonylcarbamoyl adenosine modification protein YeaZ